MIDSDNIKSLAHILTKEERVQLEYLKTKYSDDKKEMDLLVQDYLEEIQFEDRLARYIANKWYIRLLARLSKFLSKHEKK